MKKKISMLSAFFIIIIIITITLCQAIIAKAGKNPTAIKSSDIVMHISEIKDAAFDFASVENSVYEGYPIWPR